MSRVIPPGSTIGVLGGGQLGRMFAMAARRLGYRVHTLAPDDDTPTGQVADVEINASYDDLDAVRAFASAVDVVTFEFVNVSAAAAEAGVPTPTARQAVDVTRSVMAALDYVGILCIEFFIARDGSLMVNELAPRPHNSGHLTIETCRTSQFEQQLRAICGLPLGSPDALQPAAMANILGDLWESGEPDWSAVFDFPYVNIHLTGQAM